MNVLSWLWQLPQNILGLLIIAITRAKKTEDGIWICGYLFYSAISLGDYIIFQTGTGTAYNAIKHEKGHQKQSRMYGWFYLLIVGLPSISRNIWDRIIHKNWATMRRATWYYGGFPENQADKLGGVACQYH